jgi:hypothetical protein
MNREVNQDREHLKILSICFYVLSGLTLLPVFFGVIYILFGVFFGVALTGAPHRADEPPPAIMGGIFVVFGLIFAGIFGTIGVLALMTGRKLARQSSYTFCFVIAVLICLWMPLGTILGIFTMVVLTRDSVKALFNGENYQPRFGNTPPNWQ